MSDEQHVTFTLAVRASVTSTEVSTITVEEWKLHQARIGDRVAIERQKVRDGRWSRKGESVRIWIAGTLRKIRRDSAWWSQHERLPFEPTASPRRKRFRRVESRHAGRRDGQRQGR